MPIATRTKSRTHRPPPREQREQRQGVLHRHRCGVEMRHPSEVETPSDQILQGDCTALLQNLPTACADLVLTDPPYGVRYRDRSGRSIVNDDCLAPVLSAFPEVYRVLKPDSFLVCFYGWNRIGEFWRAWIGSGFRPVGHLVWHKGYASSRRFLEARHEQAYLLAKGLPRPPPDPLPDVQPWQYSGNRFHPTEKDVRILKPVIGAFCPPDGLVLDPFCGSGSTAVAASLTGRRYIGIEIDPRYCDHARRRVAGVARYTARR